VESHIENLKYFYEWRVGCVFVSDRTCDVFKIQNFVCPLVFRKVKTVEKSKNVKMKFSIAAKNESRCVYYTEISEPQKV
jgi:hypothetical protein